MASKCERAGKIVLPIRVARVARTVLLISLAVALLGIVQLAEARITRIVITSTQSPAFGGADGNVGQYEQLDGTAYGEVDPKDPLNAVITDIELAPRNSRGNVEYSMDISILKPIDMSRGNGTLIYDVANRGSKGITNFNIGGNATNAGDGFLEREGYTMAWSGWRGDVTSGSRSSCRSPSTETAARSGGGCGPSTSSAPRRVRDVTEPPSYEAVSTDNSGATLTRRVHQHDPKELIPNMQWAFADCTTVPFPGVPDPKKVCLQGGFDTNHIYELLYTAKNPMVMGLGFAATRDFNSFLRNGDQGGLVNPLGDGIEIPSPTARRRAAAGFAPSSNSASTKMKSVDRCSKGRYRTRPPTAARSTSASRSRPGSRARSTPRRSTPVLSRRRRGT